MDIRFDKATVDYEGRTALHPLSLSLGDNRVGVIGLNGSGKTTFARLIAGLARPTAGSVTLDGLDTAKDADALRGRTGFVFQHPANQIVLPIIREDIALGLKGRGLSKGEIEDEVMLALGRLGAVSLADRRPHELSGGELQLAALAAVLVTRPDLVIFDEPTNQLDLKNRSRVHATIAGLPEQAVVISHDLTLIQDFPRVLVFHAGRLAFDGPADEAVTFYRDLVLP